MKITLVIPVKDNLFYTKQFIKSLERQTFKDFAVIFVDNASTDDTKKFLITEWLQYESFESYNDVVALGRGDRHVVFNITNRGYAGGCNDGIKYALGKYPSTDILVCNNDMELLPECIAELNKVVTSGIMNQKIGILGGRLIFPDGKIQHGGAFLNTYGWGQHKLAGARTEDIVETEPEEQEYVTGALFYITRDCLKEIGLFDEQFNPAYFEEVDYCTTAREKGFRTFYVPTAVAIHHENKTSNQVLGSQEKVQNLSRTNQIKYYLKHDKLVQDYVPSSDKQALITGKIYGDWSFSIVLRNLCKGLKRNGVDVSIASEEYHNPMPMDDWEIQEMIKKPNDYWNRVVMRSSEGDHQYIMPPGKKRIAHTTFEGTRPPNTWVDQLNHVDAVVVNSSFCKNILIDRGVKTEISIVPNPVDTNHFNLDVEPIKMTNKRNFGFLLMSAYGERKNLELGIKAFIQEFGQNEDVFLSVHSLSLFYILQQMNLDIKQWVKNVIMGGVQAQNAPIMITSNSMHPMMIPSFIKIHDCLIFPSKCEGFGNAPIEAAACGIPSIATNYSGITDFISDDVGYPLNDYKLTNMPLQVLPYFRNYIGSQWAELNIEELRAKMRHAFEHQKEVKAKGLKAREKSLQYDIVPVGAQLSKVMFD